MAAGDPLLILLSFGSYVTYSFTVFHQYMVQYRQTIMVKKKEQCGIFLEFLRVGEK